MAIFVPVGDRPANELPVDQKVASLRKILREMGSVVVGYSGGADSALLLKIAHDELGDKAVGAIAVSESYPRRERDSALALAKDLGIPVEVVETREIEREEYAANPANRCYYCKLELFSHLSRIARDRGIRWLAYGANHDDLGDYRPGQEAGREVGARAPLIEAGLTKAEIRHVSHEIGLPTWDKPAMACLSSRFPYGARITKELLARVEAAEDFLRADLGFREVRVRHHDTVARIEVGADEVDRMLSRDLRMQITTRLKELGYLHVAVDLEGFRSGSMNAVLTLAPERTNGH
ncbi:MAG: ATP-dependent sacrificial sulfur transferase LarE [Capsulimonadaceae bacterium]|nr:ATP-dependent sacrificial sulfur transferase LarE [Capsulimonadaceae bacterium]